jgi:hypothetical protein
VGKLQHESNSVDPKAIQSVSAQLKEAGNGFTEREGAFLTEDALGGPMPVLVIRARVRLGALQLRVT